MKKIFITLFISVFAFTAIAQKGVYTKKGYKWDNAGRSTINAGYTPELCDIDSMLNSGVMGNLYDSIGGDYYISEIHATVNTIGRDITTLQSLLQPDFVTVATLHPGDTFALTNKQIITGGYKVDTNGGVTVLAPADIYSTCVLDIWYLLVTSQYATIPPGVDVQSFRANAALTDRNIYPMPNGAIAKWNVFYVTLQ